ncbi:glycosyltransferase [Candidatus Omnitrophota bacterium]
MNRKPYISIIIPAFNEVKRLPAFLQLVISFCNSSQRAYEIIVVDDGSSDNTFEVAQSYKTRFANLHIIRLRKNMGKGYAVKRGLLESSGEVSVFLDADGSVAPQEIEKNLHYITQEGYDIVAGSRVLRNKSQILQVKWHRKLIGTVFNFLVQTLLFKNIKDTQCGFKMFKREVVKPLFSRSYLADFGFDVEILYLAHKMGYNVKEEPVSWSHVKGSKVNLFIDSLRMFFNILQVRNWHCTPINPGSQYMGPDEYRYMYDLECYHWWFTSRRKLLAGLMKSLKIASPKILDVGCGTGANILSFKKLGDAFGIDASRQAIEFCRKRGIENTTQCPIEKLGFADKTFDIITCIDVLEHVSNPSEALLEIKRVLKDEGKLIITVPAFRILWSQHDEALCHLRRYEKSSLLSELYEAGLKAKKTGYLFFISFFAVAPIRIIRRFLILKQENVHSDTTTLPPKILNEFLKFLFNIEAQLSLCFGLPFGTTLYAVACKEANA